MCSNFSLLNIKTLNSPFGLYFCVFTNFNYCPIYPSFRFFEVLSVFPCFLETWVFIWQAVLAPHIHFIVFVSYFFRIFIYYNLLLWVIIASCFTHTFSYISRVNVLPVSVTKYCNRKIIPSSPSQTLIWKWNYFNIFWDVCVCLS